MAGRKGVNEAEWSQDASTNTPTKADKHTASFIPRPPATKATLVPYRAVLQEGP